MKAIQIHCLLFILVAALPEAGWTLALLGCIAVWLFWILDEREYNQKSNRKR